tara:strand:- start:246 stop:476 length:231 start_codon:yes stop_codon:yes gene_type:complete
MANLTESEKMTESMIIATKGKNQKSLLESKSMDLVQFLQDNALTFEEMQLVLIKSKQRIDQMIELRDLDQKYKGNE